MNKQTQETQEQRWKRIGDTYYLKFSEITTKKSQRPDLHAFQLLDEIFPDTNDIISCTTHYMIFLDFGEK